MNQINTVGNEGVAQYPMEQLEMIYDKMCSAMKRYDYQEALDNCKILLQIGTDTRLLDVHRQLAIYVKDQKINENILQFISRYNKNLPPREEAFRPEIIIPCYNQGCYLRDALASAPLGVNITIVNDASTDNTADHIGRLSKDYHFRLITNETNLNQAGSINRVINASQSNLFIILNADDILVNYAVPTILAIFAEYPTVRMVGGSCYPFSAEDQLAISGKLPYKLPYSPKPTLYNPSDARNFHQPNDINMTMSSCSFLRTAWEAVEGFWDFDNRVCSFDDRDFQMRVCALFPVAVISEPLAFYRVNSSVGRGRS